MALVRKTRGDGGVCQWFAPSYEMPGQVETTQNDETLAADTEEASELARQHKTVHAMLAPEAMQADARGGELGQLLLDSLHLRDVDLPFGAPRTRRERGQGVGKAGERIDPVQIFGRMGRLAKHRRDRTEQRRMPGNGLGDEWQKGKLHGASDKVG